MPKTTERIALERADQMLAAQDDGSAPRERLVDALADLRHHAAQHNLDWDYAVRMANTHYNAERTA